MNFEEILKRYVIHNEDDIEIYKSKYRQCDRQLYSFLLKLGRIDTNTPFPLFVKEVEYCHEYWICERVSLIEYQIKLNIKRRKRKIKSLI